MGRSLAVRQVVAIVGAAAALLPWAAPAEVVVQSQRGLVGASAGASDDNSSPQDSQQSVDDSAFVFFNRNVSAGASGTVNLGSTQFPIVVSTTAASSATAGLQVDAGAGQLLVSGTTRATVDSSRSRPQPPAVFVASDGGVFLSFRVAVQDSAATLRFDAQQTITTTALPGDGFASLGTSVRITSDGLDLGESRFCDSFDPCAETDFSFETLLPAGAVYDIEVSTSGNSSGTAGGVVEATVSLEVGVEECESKSAKAPCECDVNWNNGNGGGWGVRVNWNPEQVPEDRGAGCDNAIFALPPAYPVLFDTQTANSLLVRQGAPTFSGTLISLSGRSQAGGTQTALGIGQDAFFTLGQGRIQAPSVVVGDQAGVAAASLTLNAGTQLNVGDRLLVGQAQPGDAQALEATLTAARTTVGGHAGTSVAGLSVRGGTADLGELRVAESAPGQVDLLQGAQVSTGAARIGNAPGVSGGLTVSGAGTAWVAQGPVAVGALGAGRLAVEAGARASTRDLAVGDIGGESGVLLVTGRDGLGVASNLDVQGAMSVGLGGTGEATISAGAVLEASDGIFVGEQALGTLIVEQAASGTPARVAVLGEGIQLGGASLGEMVVLDGGDVTTNQLRVGRGSSLGSLELLKAGVQSGDPPAALRVTGDAVVGSLGLGVFNVKGASTARVRSLTLGGQVGADGEVLVEGDARGPSTLSVDESCVVGSSGNGKLRILKGGFLGVGGTLSIGPGVSGGSLLLQTLAGEVRSRLLVNGLVVVFSEARVLGDSEISSATGVRINLGGRLFLQRGLRVAAPFLEANGPVIAVGQPLKQADGTGPVTIGGDLTVGPAGSLVADLDGSGPAFLVEGDAALDGVLELRFADEDGLNAGATFALVQVAGAVSGEFAEIRFPSRSGDFSAEVSTGGGTLRILVTNPGQPVDEGEGEGEGDGEGSTEGDGEGGVEGEVEGEDPPVPPAGCAGCEGCADGGKALDPGTWLGDWLLALFGLATLLGFHLHRQRMVVRAPRAR